MRVFAPWRSGGIGRSMVSHFCSAAQRFQPLERRRNVCTEGAGDVAPARTGVLFREKGRERRQQ